VGPLSQLRGTIVVEQEVLFDLLPAGGEWLSRDAAWTALCERLVREVEAEDFNRYIWLLAERVVWSPLDGLIRRSVGDDHTHLPETIECERDLEGWFERYVWKRAATVFFQPPPRSLSIIVQNTARIGSASGRWTRPDLCMACISRYHYSPSPVFDLFSFELKMPSGCDMLAVHEALSHTAASHFAYLGLYLPQGSKEAENLPAMLEQAQHHGVGVIRITDPMSDNGYTPVLAAERQNPSPAKIDGFIEDRFDEANRLALRKWVH
jgi:hypothetical protein